MLDRKTPPVFHRINSINIPRAESALLQNGIPVHIIEAGKQPVIRLELIFRAGSWYEQVPGASYFATKLLSEGTTEFSSAVISNEIEKYGAHLELSSSMDYAVITLECLTKHLSNLIPLLSSLLYDSIFPENEFNTLKNIKSQQIRVNQEKTSVLASVKFRQLIFGADHPYGQDLSVKNIDNLQLPEVVNFYNNNFKGSFEIVLAGKPDENTFTLLDDNFGRQALFKKEAISDSKSIFTSPDKITVVEKKNNVQSSVRIGKRLFKKNHPDLIDVLILNEILGGYFGSRLMKNIREDKGYTYGISSAVITLKNEGYFIMGTDVNKENTQNTIDEIFKEIGILQTTKVDEEELDTVKNYMTGSFLSDINTPFALSDKFKAVHLNGMDYSHYNHYVKRINSISAEEIKAVANKYLSIDSFTTVVVGGMS